MTTSTTAVATVTPRDSASAAAFSIATGEKSTAVASQPCSASHTALRASPAATSIARPGASPLTSATTN